MSSKDLSHLRENYTLSSLHESSMEKTPFAQFDKWFHEAERIGGFEPNAMSLATANSQGQPSCRTVLLKKYSPDGFVFFTNYDSQKGQELAINPKASLLFFWEKMQRQIHIKGIVEKISEEDSSQYFSSRPKESQIGAIISMQSQKVPSRDFLEKRFHESKDKEIIQKPKNWGGYVVKPHYFEYWQGGAHRLHDRLIYEKNGQTWDVGRLAP